MTEDRDRKFVGLIPLRPKATAKNWNLVSDYCRVAIDSVLSADERAHVVLVCTDLPEGLQSSERLHIVKADLPTPKTLHEQMADKGEKIRLGLTSVKGYCPAWVMKVDADDLVSKRFIKHVLGLPIGEHCYVQRGWRWMNGSRFILMQHDFHLYNGSSLACYLEPGDFSQGRDSAAMEAISMSHHKAVDFLKEKKSNLSSAPFPAIIYRLNYGDNHTGQLPPMKSGRRALRLMKQRILYTRYLTSRLRADFNLS